MTIGDIVDVAAYPIDQANFRARCQSTLDENGVLVLPDFIRPAALDAIRRESIAKQPQAYFCVQNHAVYLTPHDANHPDDHPANRQVVSSKGCICDDMIGATSGLRMLYNDADFQAFVAKVTGENALHPYADPLSSINIHYANRGQELGWHFDNSSFAITLLIQKPDAGSRFEYVKDLRDADVLNGTSRPQALSMEPGTLVLFRGRNSIHRVSPNDSDKTRMLAVLAYNNEPGGALSESARMTFYGRLC